MVFFGSGLVAFLSVVGSSLAEAPALVDSRDFEQGELGPIIMTTFFSTDIVTPRWNIARWDPSCNSDELIFLGPHGIEFGGSLDIYDQHGNLMYQQPGITQAPNHNHVVRYKGQDFLVYWEGLEMKGLGQGTYYMMNSSYDVVHTIGGINGLWGDLHAFNITHDDTALYTCYDKMRADLSRYGKPKNAWVWDGVFLEVDVETKEILFQWRASEHLDFMEMGQRTIKDEDGSDEKPWDWFHINSVQKDKKGNYLVSARYNSAITYIDGKNGAILWQLGGAKNSFKDMSDGKATDFFCQHDARWADDNETAITLFDNSGYWGHKRTISRAAYIGLDFERQEATLLRGFYHPFDIRSESQGSHELLSNGHHLIGWGHAAAFSEFNAEGELICDVHFGSLLYNNASNFNHTGYAQSYRVYKQKWQGYPRWAPSCIFKNDHLWVTWNGATEVRTWTLEGGDQSLVLGDNGWQMLRETTKWSFETGLPIEKDVYGSYAAFKLTALNEFGRILGSWILDRNATIKPTSSFTADILYEGHITIRRDYAVDGLGVFVALGLLIFFFIQRPRIFNGVYRRLTLASSKLSPEVSKNTLNGRSW